MIKTAENKGSFVVPRSRDTLNMNVRSNHMDTTVQIIPVNSPAYHLNLFTVSLYGLGYWIDMNNPRRWTYPANIFIHPDGTFAMGRINNFYRRHNINHLALNLSLPYINFFQFRPQNLPKRNLWGFFGLSIGVEYAYSDNKSIALTFGGTTDFTWPFPVSWHPEGGIHESMFAHYLSLEHQFRILRRFIVGTGLSYSSTGWYYRDDGEWEWGNTIRPEPIFMSERHRTIGLSLSTYVILGKRFRLGISYRPSFYRIRPRPAWEYSHVISVDLLWNFRFGF